MSELTDYLPEIFEDFGPIGVKKMFGGYGVYREGLMFALVVDDTLYLKADGENRHHFEQQGLPPFEYLRSGKLARLSYYQAPAELLEDRESAAIWARHAYDAALRGQAQKPKRRR